MNKKIILLTLVIGLSFIGTSYVSTASALTDSDAQTYAPILYFTNSEKCYPVDVSYAIDNSYLYQVDNPVAVSTTPTAALLANYTTDNYYLDNQRGTVTSGDNRIENDYQSKMTTLGCKVYAHVDTASSTIQYWFFYAFNGGDLNRHEGDWEMIQVVLSGNQPSQVMFSQHYSGQTATWSQVEKEGTHVKVYVAKGSHANYIKSYSGKLGLASDTVGDNGKILKPQILQTGGYDVELLESQPWLSFGGHWGWVGTDQSGAAESSILGEAGPNGPKFRDNGQMYLPTTWASELQPADNNMFILEWLVYNFVMLFIIITLLSLALLGLFIYRRYKKHGLGPRIFSLFYIDGMNAKSIGNILCIVALIIAILGLFYPWYTVSANVSIPGSTQTGTFQAISIDGLNGIQIRLPDKTGPIPMGTFALPFYILLGVALVFLILSTIGVPESKKLGKKYINRGIRLLVPFILIMIFIIAVGSILPAVAPENLKGNTDVFKAANAISAAPMGGQYNVMIADTNGGTVALSWGFGLGVYLLLFAGILLIVAGVFEMMAHTTFFEQRNPKPAKKEKHKKQPEQPAEEKK